MHNDHVFRTYVYMLSIGNTDNVIFPARRALTTKNMSPDQTTHPPAAYRLPCANKSSRGHPLCPLPLLSLPIPKYTNGPGEA